VHLLSRSRRPHRSGEWTPAKAVTFIVTLAATRSVTLAAREAGMSRKAAYKLKSRDPAFAQSWTAAMSAGAKRRGQGNKVEEVHEPPIQYVQGCTSPSRLEREAAFSGMTARLRESPPLAPCDAEFRDAVGALR